MVRPLLREGRAMIENRYYAFDKEALDSMKGWKTRNVHRVLDAVLCWIWSGCDEKKLPAIESFPEISCVAETLAKRIIGWKEMQKDKHLRLSDAGKAGAMKRLAKQGLSHAEPCQANKNKNENKNENTPLPPGGGVFAGVASLVGWDSEKLDFTGTEGDFRTRVEAKCMGRDHGFSFEKGIEVARDAYLKVNPRTIRNLGRWLETMVMRYGSSSYQPEKKEAAADCGLTPVKSVSHSGNEREW